MNGTGLTAPLLLESPPRCTSKWTCGPEELPLEPECPIGWPAVTVCPTMPSGRETMWQYRVITLPACRMSTYQPQPCTAADPSTSQLQKLPSGAEALHLAVTTTPADAAWITVPFGTPRST